MSCAQRNSIDEGLRTRERRSDDTRRMSASVTTRGGDSAARSGRQERVGASNRYMQYVQHMVYSEVPKNALLGGHQQSNLVMLRSFHATALWIAMLLRRYYVGAAPLDDTNVPPISCDALAAVVRNSVVLGIYMWDVVCMRLQCRKFRRDVLYNREVVERINRDASEEVPRFVAERRRMCDRTYINDWPEVSIQSVVREFVMRGVVAAERKVPVRTDPDRANLDKRYALVKLLEASSPSSTREPRNSYEIEVMINQGYIDQLNEMLRKWRCTKKFAWFVFYVLPMKFTLFMLRWYDRMDGDEPHQDFVRAEPLFLYFYGILARREFVANEKSAAGIIKEAEELGQRRSDNVQVANGAPHGQEELIIFLDVMLNAIRCTRQQQRCKSCACTLIDALYGSASTTPDMNRELRRCPVAMCALSIKRRVQNMTKRISKGTSSCPLEVAASPVLKQMLSLVSITAKARRDREARREPPPPNASLSASIVHKHRLRREAFAGDILAAAHVDDMAEFTVYPFTVEEMLKLSDARSFVMSVNMASGALMHLSIHVLDPDVDRRDSRFLVFTPFCQLGEDVARVGSYVVHGVRDMVRFWENSPFNDRNRIMDVQVFRVGDESTRKFCANLFDTIPDFVRSCE